MLSTASPAFEDSVVDQSIADIQDGVYSGIDGILIYVDGERVREHYFNQFDADQVHQTRSTFKSITGLLSAIAFDQNLLSPDELVLPLLSRYVSQESADPQRAQIRVKDLLHMSSGLDCSEMPGTGPYHDEIVDDGPEPLKYSLSIAMTTEPGKQWAYCNANTFLLGTTISAALDRAERPNISEFANAYLFAPLGIEEYQIYQSPDGFLYAQGNARFRPRDLAKFGLLVLNHGTWRGEQIVSNRHMQAIVDGMVGTPWSWTDLIEEHQASESKYAYQWFRTVFHVHGETVAVSHTWGNGGQFIFVIPSLNAVVVFTGSNYGDIEKQKQAFEILHSYLQAAVK